MINYVGRIDKLTNSPQNGIRAHQYADTEATEDIAWREQR